MKTKIILIASLMTLNSFSQQLNDVKKRDIVQNLNAPTKIWIDGCWKIQKNGTKKWKKRSLDL
jgi:hypothetical protein